MLRQLGLAAIAALSVFALGVAGIRYIEGFSWAEAAYFTIITLSGVGFGDVVPTTGEGRLFTSFIVIIGLAVVAFALSILTAVQIKQIWGTLSMKNRIADLENHVVVCGAGRVGRNIISRLKMENQAFVVLENDEEVCRQLQDEGILVIHADATLDETMLEAGIKKAQGIITAMANDADNVYVTLTARSLNPHIKIVARASRLEAEAKLKQAGANAVIFPSEMGARQMVSSLLQPVIVDFMETVIYNKELNLDIAEIPLGLSSGFIGRTVRNSGIKETYDAIIVALKRGEQFIVNPRPEEPFDAGDILIALGSRSDLLKLASDAQKHMA